LFVSGACAFSTAQAAASGTAAEALNKDAVCTKCHDETEIKPVLSIYATAHGVKADSRTPTCQSCHGESDAHVKNPEGKATRPAVDILYGVKSGKGSSYGRTEAGQQSASCLRCHEGTKRQNWVGGQHQVNDVPCVACHTIHAKNDNVRIKATQPQVCFTCHKEQRAMSMKISHHAINEGKVACSDCHNPHGSVSPKMLKKNTVNETCYTCHAEKRGPFLWEHQPATEDCTTCHTPHGSNLTPLLKSRTPFLCDECHDGPHQSDTPVARNAAGKQAGLTAVPSENYTGRACMNCHSMVHGSNHPAGALLHR